MLPLARRQIAIFGKILRQRMEQPRPGWTWYDVSASRAGATSCGSCCTTPIPCTGPAHDCSALLRQFSHVISIHETQDQAKNVYDPFVLVDDRHYAHRFHYDGAQGMLAIDDPHGARTLRDRFEEIWAASDPAIPATTLGL